MSDVSANKKVVLTYVEAMNAGDFERLASLFTPDTVLHGVVGKGSVEFAMPVWKDLHTALQMRLAVEELIEEGDVVAARFRETGMSVAPFRGLPATGKSFELTAIEWFALKDGRIASRHGVRDSASQARQLGWG